jgi:DNA (cytosine-5)-methyltransferase 1
MMDHVWIIEAEWSRENGVADALTAAVPSIDVYDFFSGCGGTSAGLRAAGLHPKVAVDFDRDALATYALNFPEAVTLQRDITSLQTVELETFFDKSRTRPALFCACAPCQPFSKQNRQKKNGDKRASLLSHLRRFVERFRPELLLIENVPGIRHADQDGFSPLQELEDMLKTLGYWYDAGKLFAPDFGVPQSRRRLFVVASLFGQIRLPKATHGTENMPHRTVAEAIGDLPRLTAGETHPDTPNHRAAGLSVQNLERIRATKAGGGWSDWNDEIKLNCHASIDGYTDVYGRMAWDKLAPTLTTRCVSLSNGRFGHPDQDRAISVREAACLQTFDRDFVFSGNLAAMAKQIGNAVPVAVATAIGHAFRQHISEQAPW